MIRRPIALQPLRARTQHLARQIDARDPRVGIGELQQVPGDLAGAAADVEDRLHAAQVELARANQPPAELNVQRDLAGRAPSNAPCRPPYTSLIFVAILIRRSRGRMRSFSTIRFRMFPWLLMPAFPSCL